MSAAVVVPTVAVGALGLSVAVGGEVAVVVGVLADVVVAGPPFTE